VPRLVVRSGPDSGRIIGLEQGEVTLGRAPENGVVLRSDSVSRQHARIAVTAETVTVEDLGSKNATLVDGVRAVGPVALSDGQKLELGDVVLEFQVDAPTVTVAAGRGGPAATRSDVLHVDRSRAAVRIRGAEVELPPKEYAALTLLFERAGQVVSKEDLALHVWPEYQGDVSDYNIHQVVSRLRKAIEADATRPRLLITRPGFGYRLDLTAPDA
jgi:hypothetical protein